MSRPNEHDSVDVIVSENDPGNAKIEVRSELTFSLRKNGDKPFMMVHDELNSQFYRLGINEWKMAKLFDGNRTMRQVIREATLRLGEEHASPQEVSRLAGWLVQAGLARVNEGALVDTSTSNSATRGWHDPLKQASKLGQWNPLFLKISLPDPSPLLAWIAPVLSLFFSRTFLLVWLAVCGFGAYCVAASWGEFRSSLNDVFTQENWFYLLAVWVVLKVIHELGHAIACMRYGGKVTRCGLMFIVFSPIAWVDVTSAWSFRSRWQRIVVSAAGMYIEFFVAAIAAIVWAKTESPAIASLSRNVVLSASVTTLLFNLNFLMRFDGYYILTDLLDIQNLYGAGQQYVQYFNRRYILGMSAICPGYSGAKLWLVRLYGVGAMVWRITFCVGILIVAAHLFKGAGIVLALFSGVLWFGIPLLRFLLTLALGQGRERPNVLRFGLLAGTALALIATLMVAPWPGRTMAHGVVQYAPLQPIRVNSPGFIRQIRSEPGDSVAEGEVLLTLENRELENELADLELQIQIQEIAQRIAHRENEMAEYEAIGKKLDSLKEQRSRVAGKVATLEVRAPIQGTIIAADLESLEGKYVETGTELLSVGSVGEKEVRISIKQEHVESFRDGTNRDVQISVRGHGLEQQDAKIERVNPRASRRVLHEALAATAGGPLAVQQNPDDRADDMLLVDPHFEGVIRVPNELSDDLRSGEVCRVSLGRGHQRVYEKLFSYARTYFKTKSGGNFL